MELETARHVLADARVGRLATITADGRPHMVPCCFALHGDRIYSAVDAKPKSSLALRRLDNLRVNAVFSLLVDHYDEDWATLWWVRVDGVGRIVDDEDERTHALHLLGAKYAQYLSVPPPGEVMALDIELWRSWP
jgi:PPOX class probable F420-dependent enzyme